jgi:hypothetical protein
MEPCGEGDEEGGGGRSKFWAEAEANGRRRSTARPGVGEEMEHGSLFAATDDAGVRSLLV